MAQIDFIKAKLDLIKLLIIAIFGVIFSILFYVAQNPVMLSTLRLYALVVIVFLVFLAFVILYRRYNSLTNELKELSDEVLNKSMISALNEKEEKHERHESSEYLNNDRTAWLWEHITHSETVFTNRINFFLVAESVFMVSYATLQDTGEIEVKAIISVLGFFFTWAWLYVNSRTFINLKEVSKRFGIAVTEYRELRDKASGISANIILGVILPSITLLGWIVLIYQLQPSFIVGLLLTVALFCVFFSIVEKIWIG